MVKTFSKDIKTRPTTALANDTATRNWTQTKEDGGSILCRSKLRNCVEIVAQKKLFKIFLNLRLSCRKEVTMVHLGMHVES